MEAIKRIFLLFLVFWLSISQNGFSYNTSTCLFTGAQKVALSFSKKSTDFSHSKLPNLKRSSCYKYASFSVKSNISTSLVKKSTFSSQSLSFLTLFQSPFWGIALPVLGKVQFRLDEIVVDSQNRKLAKIQQFII